MPGQELEQAQRRNRHPVAGNHPGAITGHEDVKLAGRTDRLVPDRAHAVEEEVEPPLPVTLPANGVEPPVVVLAMAFEVEAQVEQRLREQLPVFEQKRDEETTDASIPVEVGVDGLEAEVRICRCSTRATPRSERSR
jgi:hypothetical protein